MSDTANPPKSLLDDFELIADCARFAEGGFSEADVRKRHRLPADVWEALGNDDLFVEKVLEERRRRISSGILKRERAQQHVVKAPDILAAIMEDPKQSARHRIDSARTLDTMSDTGPDSPPARDVFVIKINIGGDVHTFGKLPDPTDSKMIEHEVIKRDTTTDDDDDDDNADIRWRGVVPSKDTPGTGGAPAW